MANSVHEHCSALTWRRILLAQSSQRPQQLLLFSFHGDDAFGKSVLAFGRHPRRVAAVVGECDGDVAVPLNDLVTCFHVRRARRAVNRA